jgi:hypothetical protein
LATARRRECANLRTLPAPRARLYETVGEAIGAFITHVTTMSLAMFEWTLHVRCAPRCAETDNDLVRRGQLCPRVSSKE